MDVGVYAYTAGDPVLIDKIVNEFLSQGKFDKLRKECMADADTKVFVPPSYIFRVKLFLARFTVEQRECRI